MTVASGVVSAICVVHVKRPGYFSGLTTADLLQANDVWTCRTYGRNNTVKIIVAALKEGTAGITPLLSATAVTDIE